MAGMFSLLHKSQLRLDAGASASGADDGIGDFRTVPNGSPHTGRRILGIRQMHVKSMAPSSDRLPKRFRKRRCHEIHPLLRRSVCTLLLAGCGIVTGFVILLIHFYNWNQVSIPGSVILGTSLGFCLIGVMWFCWSLTKLRKFNKKTLEVKALRESRQEKVINTHPMHWPQGACDPATLSASKWPVKRTSCEKSDSWDECMEEGYTTGPDDDTRRGLSESDQGDARPIFRHESSCSSGDDSIFSKRSLTTSGRRVSPEEMTCVRSISETQSRNIGRRGINAQIVPKIFVTNFASELPGNTREVSDSRMKSYEMGRIIMRPIEGQISTSVRIENQ